MRISGVLAIPDAFIDYNILNLGYLNGFIYIFWSVSGMIKFMANLYFLSDLYGSDLKFS